MFNDIYSFYYNFFFFNQDYKLRDARVMNELMDRTFCWRIMIKCTIGQLCVYRLLLFNLPITVDKKETDKTRVYIKINEKTQRLKDINGTGGNATRDNWPTIISHFTNQSGNQKYILYLSRVYITILSVFNYRRWLRGVNPQVWGNTRRDYELQVELFPKLCPVTFGQVQFVRWHSDNMLPSYRSCLNA